MGEAGSEYGFSQCSKKKKMALVSYRPFIDFAFPPSISFLLVAASYCLLKKEKCQNLQIFQGPGTGCWTSPFPSQEKSLFRFSFNFDSFFAFLMYIACASPLPIILWGVYKAARRGKKETDYLKATVRAFVIIMRTPWFLLEEWSFNARVGFGRPGVCI